LVLDALIDELSVFIEREHTEIARGLRDTWNPHAGTLSGHWVSELQRQILSLLSRFADSDKIEAYNEIADAEGLSRLDENDQDVDFWIYEAFINQVIDRLVETDPKKKSSDSNPR